MGTGVATRRAAFIADVETKMRAAAVPDKVAAMVLLDVTSAPTDGFERPPSTRSKVESKLGPQSARILGDSLGEMDRVLHRGLVAGSGERGRRFVDPA